MKYDFDQAKNLAESHYMAILEDLGLKIDRYGDSKGPCPVHGGDNGRAFSYCSKRHTWLCFTHKCHEKDGCSILGLIKGVRECSWTDVMLYIERIAGKKIEQVTESDIERKQFIQSNVRKTEEYLPILYPESVLQNVDRNYEYFINRGCSERVLAEYDNFICHDPRKPLGGRSCFPLRDDCDKIVGFTGRSLDNQEPKWKFVASKRVTSNTLFGLNRAKTAIEETGTAILVEGFLDQIRLTENGILNSVCSFGVDLAEGQRNLLLKYKTKRLVIAFDPDEAGIAGSKRVEKKTKLLFDVINITEEIPVEPGDMSASQIDEYFGIYK